jgi:hypothetical protein
MNAPTPASYYEDKIVDAFSGRRIWGAWPRVYSQTAGRASAAPCTRAWAHRDGAATKPARCRGTAAAGV